MRRSPLAHPDRQQPALNPDIQTSAPAIWLQPCGQSRFPHPSGKSSASEHLPHQYLRQTLFQHVVEVHAIRRWWGIHAQIEDSGQFDFWRRNISASSAASLQQVAASGFVVCARDRRQVDVQLGCNWRCGGKRSPGVKDPSATAACKASAICKKRGPPCAVNRGNQIGNLSSCMVFNGDVLSQCMEIAFK